MKPFLLLTDGSQQLRQCLSCSFESDVLDCEKAFLCDNRMWLCTKQTAEKLTVAVTAFSTMWDWIRLQCRVHTDNAMTDLCCSVPLWVLISNQTLLQTLPFTATTKTLAAETSTVRLQRICISVLSRGTPTPFCYLAESYETINQLIPLPFAKNDAQIIGL